jgi:hypothetical protein
MDEKQLQTILDELQQDDLNSEIIYDNKLHFQVKNEIYRVRIPNQKQHSLATNHKNKLYIQLLQQENTLTIKQLSKILLEKQNIDIGQMDQEAKDLENQMTQVYLSLAKKKDSEVESINKLKKQLAEIRNKRLIIILEKSNFLSPAIENQVQDLYYRFLTAICTEKLIKQKDDKELWIPVWKNFEHFEEDDSKLAYIALARLTELMFGV